MPQAAVKVKCQNVLVQSMAASAGDRHAFRPLRFVRLSRRIPLEGKSDVLKRQKERLKFTVSIHSIYLNGEHVWFTDRLLERNTEGQGHPDLQLFRAHDIFGYLCPWALNEIISENPLTTAGQGLGQLPHRHVFQLLEGEGARTSACLRS